MFDRFLKRERPRVFLGTLSVVPRSDWKRHLDQWGLLESRSHLDERLGYALSELFNLPPVSGAGDPLPTDLAVDVAVCSFQLGDLWVLDLGHVPLPLFWRPKVSVACRLFHLASGETRRTFEETRKLPWGEFWRRQLRPGALLGLRPAFDHKDLEPLLLGACHRLVDRMRKVL